MEIQLASKNHGRSKLGVGCLVLFALPFAGVGVFAAILAARKAAEGQWREAGILALFALTFGGVGFGLIVGSFMGARKLTQHQKREAEFPNEPWRWREDWASGRVVSNNRLAMLIAWPFALLWNAISSMIWFMLPRELEKGNKVALIGLIFPLVGLGLLIWAVRATRRWRKFGVVTFDLTTVPVKLGGELSGLITTPAPLVGAREVLLQLSCVRHERHGEDSHDKLLWEDSKQLDADALITASGIPVYFRLPQDGVPASPKQDSSYVKWQLCVKAATGGVDFAAMFELPVFGVTAGVSTAVPDPTAPWQKDAGQFSPDPASRIRIQTMLTGETEFLFPPLRNLGPAIFLALFTLGFSVATWFLIVKSAPLIFPITFGFFSGLLWLLTFGVWFGASRIVCGASGLEANQRWLFLKSRTKFNREEIKDIKLHIGMRSGTKAYYDLRLVTRIGRERTLASSIANKREAEWLAQQMKMALALKDEAATAGHA